MKTNKYSINQQGFSLVEILISVLIFSIGILGLGGLQIVSLKGSNNAHYRTTASMLAMDFSDRMRSNLEGVNAGLYDADISCSATNIPICRDLNQDCSAAQLTQYDIQEVKCGMLGSNGSRDGGAINLLPSGDIQVTCVGGCNQPKAIHDITVSWNEQGQDPRSNSYLPRSLKVSVLP